jgi:uncharacterized protein (DUF1778 family)
MTIDNEIIDNLLKDYQKPEEAHAKAKYVPMRLKEEDFKAFSKAAKANKQTLSEWMRATLRAATQNGTEAT